MIISNAIDYKEQVIGLLEAEKLPGADLPENLYNFFVAIGDGKVIGVAGMEVYGKYGLLRSVAVLPNHRGLGIAAKLIGHITLLGNQKGLSELYLLTETAPEYFKNKGFVQIGREEVPAELQISSEFSHVCPVSAIVMKRSIS
jgi:amino-acid N-acetyltransferase